MKIMFSMENELLLWCIIGALLLGMLVCLAGCLRLRQRLQHMTVQVKEQAQAITQDQAMLQDLQQTLQGEITAHAITQERARQGEQAQKHAVQLQEELNAGHSRIAELQTALRLERQQAQEKIALLEHNHQALTETFRQLSAEALNKNNQSFLDLARHSFKQLQELAQQDLQQKQGAISEMLTPIQQALLHVDHKIQGMEKQRVGAYEGLRQQVHELVRTQKELRTETGNLVKALRAPTVRGQWGEMQLKRVVEMAGMISHCDFVEQASTETESGRLRPDMIVRLPNQKKIIVDSKAPLFAYLEALEAPDEDTRKAHMHEHARQVRQHIRALSARAYWDQFDDTPEFVVMFLPGETFFSAALEYDPTLIEVGVKEKVILATPTTLIALLRAVAYGWRQESLAENARHIAALGQELYKRLSDLGGHFSRLGRHLGQAVETYNQSVGTLERRVLVSARRFQELDSSQTELPVLPPVSQTARTLQAPEYEEMDPAPVSPHDTKIA